MRQDVFKQYLLETWPRGHLWQCKASLHGREVGERAVADTEEKAIQMAKAQLGSREATISASRGSDGSPSALEFQEAIARVSMTDAQERMLRAHFAAEDHCLTATQLAHAAGYSSYSSANLHYGKLGQAIAIELNYNPRRRDDGSEIWTSTIADEASRISNAFDEAAIHRAAARRDDDVHFEWKMRPQVVEALRTLGF